MIRSRPFVHLFPVPLFLIIFRAMQASRNRSRLQVTYPVLELSMPRSSPALKAQKPSLGASRTSSCGIPTRPPPNAGLHDYIAMIKTGPELGLRCCVATCMLQPFPGELPIKPPCQSSIHYPSLSGRVRSCLLSFVFWYGSDCRASSRLHPAILTFAGSFLQQYEVLTRLPSAASRRCLLLLRSAMSQLPLP